jgi:hypothetical protein
MYAAQMQPDEIAGMTLDEHVNAFVAYVAGLLGDFDRYIGTKPASPGKDGAGYRVGAMWLTDAELADYLRELTAISQPRLANAPGAGRRRRMLYTVLLPAPNAQHDEAGRPPPLPWRATETKKESS